MSTNYLIVHKQCIRYMVMATLRFADCTSFDCLISAIAFDSDALFDFAYHFYVFRATKTEHHTK